MTLNIFRLTISSAYFSIHYTTSLKLKQKSPGYVFHVRKLSFDLWDIYDEAFEALIEKIVISQPLNGKP